MPGLFAAPMSSLCSKLLIGPYTGGSVATLALLGDAFRRGPRDLKIRRSLNVSGGLSHAKHIRFPVGLYAVHHPVPRQPVGRFFGPFEVAIGEGEVDIVESFRVRVHVAQE